MFGQILMIAFALLAIDRLGLYMESRGWIYWRKRKSSVGLGGALEELNAVLRPSVRHVKEIKQKDSKPREAQGDPPSSL